jgi:malonyl-CoA decarboxylase
MEIVMTPVNLTFSDLSNTKLAPLDRAKQLAATLLSERSEASGALVARQLHEVLGALGASDRHGGSSSRPCLVTHPPHLRAPYV